MSLIIGLVLGEIMEERLRESLSMSAGDPQGLMKVFEAKSGLFSARLAALASVFREESRFGLYHDRVDYPEKDDANWQTRVIVRRGPDGPVLEKERT